MHFFVLFAFLFYFIGIANSYCEQSRDYPNYDEQNSEWMDEKLPSAQSINGHVLTLLASALDSLNILINEGERTNPKTLNFWLKNNDGYSSGDKVVWSKITELVELDLQNKEFDLVNHMTTNLDDIEYAICASDILFIERNDQKWFIPTRFLSNDEINGIGTNGQEVTFNTTEIARAVVFDAQNFVPRMYKIQYNFSYVSKCDPRWGDELLGTSSKTFCESGVILAIFTTFLNELNVKLNNEEVNMISLNSWLNDNNGFLNDNLFIWDSISSIDSERPLPRIYTSCTDISILEENIYLDNLIVGKTLDSRFVLVTGIRDHEIILYFDPKKSELAQEEFKYFEYVHIYDTSNFKN